MLFVNCWQLISIAYLGTLAFAASTLRNSAPNTIAIAGHHTSNKTNPFNTPIASCGRIIHGRSLRLVYTSEGPDTQHTAFENLIGYCMRVYGHEGAMHGLDARVGPKPILLVKDNLHYVLYEINEQYMMTWRMAIGVLGLVEYCNRRGFVEEFVADVEIGGGVDRLARVALFSERPPTGDA